MATSKSNLAFGLFLICIGLASLAVTHKKLGTILRGWDAQFYYSQAHSLVFHRATDLTSSIEESPWAEDFGPNGIQNLPRRNENVINKYPVGLSLIESPMLLVGDLVGKFIRIPSDSSRARGWTAVSVLTVASGLFLVAALGLYSLFVRLQSEFGFWAAVTGVLSCWFGTSLFYYTAVNPFMAHGAGFTLVVLLVLQVERICQENLIRQSDAIKTAILAGLLFLVRPQQILLLPIIGFFVPRSIWLNRRAVSAVTMFSIVFVLICLTQPLFHFLNLGRFSVNAYADGGEGFHWLHPDWFTVLISPHRGLLFFSPVVFVAAFRFSDRSSLTFCERVFLLHGISQAYLIMCWSSPDQGNAFGARMWCEAAPLIAFFVSRITHTVQRIDSPSFSAGWRTACGATCLWTILLLLVFVRHGGIRNGQSYAEILNLAIPTPTESKFEAESLQIEP
jgi:hypothetical protein